MESVCCWSGIWGDGGEEGPAMVVGQRLRWKRGVAGIVCVDGDLSFVCSQSVVEMRYPFVTAGAYGARLHDLN